VFFFDFKKRTKEGKKEKRRGRNKESTKEYLSYYPFGERGRKKKGERGRKKKERGQLELPTYSTVPNKKKICFPYFNFLICFYF
jgi:hypothetical protein